MKKLLTLLLLGVVIGAGYNTYAHQNTKQQILLPTTTVKDEYTQDVQKERLAKLSNPNLIKGELIRIGNLTTIQGEYQYKDQLTQKGIADITLRQMNIDLTYRYGMGIDLSKVQVSKIEGATITIKIPKSEIQLQYIEMMPEKSNISNGKKMILVSQFTAEDGALVMEQAQDKVTEVVKNNNEYKNLAIRNLKFDLEDLGHRIGYDKIIFVEV